MYEFTMMRSQDPEALLVIYGIAVVIGLVVGLGIAAVICFILSDCFKAIPQEHREMEPGMVWLLMIPCFPLVWNFFVFLKLPKSYQSYFAAQGVEDVGDCSEKLGLWYAITVACSIIPCVNYIAGPASLVLLIIYLVKAVELKKRVLQTLSLPDGRG
jgi:hypothetical protein